MTEIDQISSIRKLIFSGKLKPALDGLFKLLGKCKDLELRNRIILGCSRISSCIDEQIRGTDKSKEEYNSGVFSILEYLDELDKYYQNIAPSLYLTNEELNLDSLSVQQLYSHIKNNINDLGDLDKFDDLNDFDRGLIYEQRLRLNNLIYREIDEKIAPYYGNLIFNRLFYSNDLTKIEIDEINKLAADSSFLWYQKSIIVSGLSLSLIREFKIEKVEILLNFLNQFENKVWQKALLGLVLGLLNRDNLLLLYPEVVKRLNNLKEINEIGKGLAHIEIDLRNRQYKGCFEWNFIRHINNTDGYKVLVKPEYWFLPFYKDNPILKELPSNLPNIEGIGDLPQLLLNDKHLCNSQKYVIGLNIGKWSKDKVKYLINELKKSQHCVNNHIYDSYLSDFYWFYDLYKKDNFDEKFSDKIKIYDTALADLMMNEQNKEVYDIVIEYSTGNQVYALDKFSQMIPSIDQKAMYKKEFGYFNFLLNRYEESISLFKSMFGNL